MRCEAVKQSAQRPAGRAVPAGEGDKQGPALVRRAVKAHGRRLRKQVEQLLRGKGGDGGQAPAGCPKPGFRRRD